MNRLKFLLASFVVVVLALGIYSCAKEDNQTSSTQQVIESRTNLPSTINGMLSFPTYQDFEYFVTNLKNQEQDSTTARNAFAALGIDLNIEQTTNITDYPVCRLTENGISGFTSARRIEEDAINADLNAGGDAFSIIEDVYRKTALNSDMSVHIGTRIFKYYDNERLVIVLNNDWSAYNTIKNSTYDQLNSNLQNVLITSTDKSNWSWIYNLNSLGEIISEKEIVLPDVSALDGCDLSTSFVKTTLTNGDIRFQLNLSFTPPIIEWIFSDGTILTGNPVTRPCTSSGTVKVVLRNSSGRIICVSTNLMSYVCDNCGEKRTRNDELIRTVNGETWRIQASIWVRSGQVGCSMNYKRRRLGLWLPANNRGVRTDISGTYKRELPNKSCIDITVSGVTALGEGTFPTSISVTIPDIDKIFREPDKLTSGHRVNVKGTWFGFGVNGVPRLILD